MIEFLALPITYFIFHFCNIDFAISWYLIILIRIIANLLPQIMWNGILLLLSARSFQKFHKAPCTESFFSKICTKNGINSWFNLTFPTIATCKALISDLKPTMQIWKKNLDLQEFPIFDGNLWRHSALLWLRKL